MERFSSLTGKRALIAAGLVALVVFAAPRGVMAQDAAAAQPDPLKFTSNSPILLLNYVKADKMAEFEQAWTTIRALIAKSDNADLKALGVSLGKLSRVDQAPVPVNGTQAVLYIFQIDAPSTMFSYNPRSILYESLKAGQEGSPVTRAEADPPYNALGAAYVSIIPWKLIGTK